jgi:rubredoxin
MTLSVIKELQSKVSMLEKSNKVLTERLGRAEHKVGVLMQWALSFPGIAASQGLAQLSSQTTSIRPMGFQATARKRRPAVSTLNRRPMMRGKVGTKSIKIESAAASTSQSANKAETSEGETSATSAATASGQESHTETITVQVIGEEEAEALQNLEQQHTEIPMVETAGEVEANELVQNCGEMEEVEVETEPKNVKVIQIRHARYVCNICGSGYSYQHGLSRHMNAAHERKSEFMCKFCSKTFHRKDKYRQHEALCGKKLTV